MSPAELSRAPASCSRHAGCAAPRCSPSATSWVGRPGPHSTRSTVSERRAPSRPRRGQTADKRAVLAGEPTLSAFVFKIQAHMDPNHRDRIAFVRLCSGKLTRGMRVTQVRTGKTIGLHAPQFFFAQDRALAEEAYAGDVVGIPNHGTLRIGDTLTDGEQINFAGVPN